MSHNIAKKLLKVFLWIIFSIVIIAIVIPVLVYMPFVQDFALKTATEYFAESTGMKIDIGKLRLGFPLKLNIDDAVVIQENGDTMLTSKHALVNIKFMPLLRGKVDVGSLRLDSSFYQFGNPDSTMWLRANISSANIDGADIDMHNADINLSNAHISGIKVKLRMLEDSTSAPLDTTKSTPWNIYAGSIKVSDLHYEMSMELLIDSLGCRVDAMELTEATVDMGRKLILGRSLNVDSVSASYIYPITETTSENKNTDISENTDKTESWTIKAETLRLTAKDALYAQNGVKPSIGFDPAYIRLNDIAIEIDSFYNKGSDIRVPLKRLQATERCGISLYGDGVFSMDSVKMTARSFVLETLRSSLKLDGEMGMGDLLKDKSLPLMLKATGRIDPKEIAMVMPEMQHLLKPLKPLSLSADIEGNTGVLNVYSINLRMPDIIQLSLQGEVANPFDPSRLGGELSMDGHLANMTEKQFSFLPVKMLPALAIKGTVDYYPERVSGDFNVTTRNGELAGIGRWNGRAESYDASLRLDEFPVDAFMPELGIGRVTALATIDGKGYNPMKKTSFIDVDVKLNEIEYNNETYNDIALEASLHNGDAAGTLRSSNINMNASADFKARLDGDTVRWDIVSDIRNLDLLALGLSDSLNRGNLNVRTDGYYNISSLEIDADANISHLTWNLPGADIVSSMPIDIDLSSCDSLLDAKVQNGDLKFELISRTPLLPFIDALGNGMSEVDKQVDSMRIDVEKLHQVFPRLNMVFDMGKNNVASSFLKENSNIEFSRLVAGLHNDSVISMNTFVDGFVSGSTRLDSVSFNAMQHSQYLVYRAEINNRPGTFDDFAHVAMNGFAGINRLSVFMNQHNIKGEKGFNFGLSAILKDSVVTIKLVPLKPTIAYKPWTINKDNFISLNLTNRHLDANLALKGDNSFIKLFTEHPAETTDSLIEHAHQSENSQEDLILQVSQVHLQDWLSINPFAPPIKGDLNADIRFRYEDNVLTGKGSVGLSDLFYGRDRVGTFDLDVNVANSIGGRLMADVSLMVDSVKTITAQGVLNDSTMENPFLLDFRMIKFPLRVVNPFIPQGMATLNGMLNGEMKITGDMTKPVFNGFIDFDTTSVKVKMLGTSFRFSEEKIPVDSGIISFNDFMIKAANDNPLVVNGTVNARNLANLALNLDLKAKNMQIVNSTRPHGADVYGKAFVNVDASAKGDMKFLKVNADLRLLSGTNITYILSETAQSLSSQSTEDMVHFVQFNDTTGISKADSIVVSSMALDLDARLRIDNGSTINVDLSANGSNRIHLQPSGDVTFSMSELNGDRMTGRIDINSGFVRYTPPFMSEKQFEFQEGSYVAFNGELMNPRLNIKAIDVMKANVTQQGQNSRLVNFDVILTVTNTLESMNIAFDLATDDDITVQNELASMSAEQRANQAMNLLLYNVYTGAGTKGNANLSGNQLYSFLTSKLNSWAANNIRGVDISFGIDQYDKTYGGATSSTTSYSYRLSKTFFNDRFKIVVGGNYSTDADADENFSQNLVNDISFEYMLNKSGSMYIKIFRHTGYESILEGEITQTGVGFVFKKKLNTLWELFGIRRD